jgi:zinc protease
MEADRMRDLDMTEDDVRTERDVVLEERNQRTDGEAGALFQEQSRAAQYLNHPYGTPIIGWRHEIRKLNREDAFAFYQRYYAPNNAVLVVAGDVDPNEVRALAEKHYGPVRPTVDLGERERPEEPPQLAERRLMFTDARVSQPYISRSYLAPERDAGDQREAAKLTILAELLGGNGATSVLGRKLQFGSQQAIYASAYYNGMSLDESTFGLVMVPTPGTEMRAAEEALDGALDEFLSEGVETAQFERLKFQIKAAQIYAEDDIQSLARKYGAGLSSGLTTDDVEAWPELLTSVTEEEVMDAARKVFDRQNAVTGWVMPADATEVMQ